MFISDQILLKLESDVDEYLHLPCVGTKLTKANGKWVVETLIHRYCLHGIPSMFYICKVWKDTLSLCETTNVFIDAYLLLQNPVSSVRAVWID